MTTKRCPNCGTEDSEIFHRISGVPVNSCLLFTDRGRAERLPKGDIDLAFCGNCAFVFNAAWESGATTYSDLYEETQVFSETYRTYQKQLAEDLIGRYDLFGKEIVEIGCGKGAFLSLLCDMGDNAGVGYDPSFVPERAETGGANVTFRREYFSETTDQAAPDFICCRMTLEHIADTQRFVRAVRRIASPERGTVVFFQIPDVRRILAEGAFWDVYYEHCSYFSPASLGYLFRSAGFDILRMDSSYDDQYLTIEAYPSEPASMGVAAARDGAVEQLARDVAKFTDAVSEAASYWDALIGSVSRKGGRVALWGSGSKAVAFLSAVRAAQEVEFLVDINPFRWGKFVPGTGKQIVSPEHLTRFPPDLVVAMNPIYRQEIAAELVRYGGGAVTLGALGDLQAEPVSASMLV